jgi:hypothetical protein
MVPNTISITAAASQSTSTSPACEKPKMSVPALDDRFTESISGNYYVSASSTSCKLFSGNGYFTMYPINSTVISFDTDFNNTFRNWSSIGLVAQVDLATGNVSGNGGSVTGVFKTSGEGRIYLVLNAGECYYKSVCISGMCSLMSWVQGSISPYTVTAPATSTISPPTAVTATSTVSPPTVVTAQPSSSNYAPFYVPDGWMCYNMNSTSSQQKTWSS